MAHNWTVWGHQMALQDYSSQHVYKHGQDRGVWDQVVQMAWHKVKSMHDALQEAKLSRSTAIPIYKAPCETPTGIMMISLVPCVFHYTSSHSTADDAGLHKLVLGQSKE